MLVSEISKGIVFRGEVYTKDKLHIDGQVIGIIRNDSEVSISEVANVKATFEVQDLKISGTVQGNVNTGTFVHLHATANFTGDISSKDIKIDKGAVINGSIIMTKK